MPLAVVALAALSNTAEITSSNLRNGAALDNVPPARSHPRPPRDASPRRATCSARSPIESRARTPPQVKASWNQALKLGDFSSNLKCNYDRNANKEFLKDVQLSGDLLEASNSDDVRVSYEVSHNFADKSTNVQLSANTQGTTLNAEIDDRQLKEVSAERDVEMGGQTVNVQPSWMVKAKSARVKLMSSLGKASDKVSAQVDYDTNNRELSNLEVGYQHNLEDGRDVAATLRPNSKELDVELVDNKFEDGATWTAKASVPLESSGGNLLDQAKVTLKRAWSW